MSYCQNCGYDDQCSDDMIEARCQRCGAIKHSNGSISYNASREDIEDMEDQIEEFDREYDD